jgi:hypothetical protein
MRRFALIVAAFLLAAPALAQPLRSIVVPGDATVAIPPRGQAWPAPAPAPAPAGIVQGLPVMPAAPPPAAAPLAAMPLGLAAIPGLIVPLVAGALLGGSLAGGGSGGSAPAATR